MQFYTKSNKAGAFGVNNSWKNTIHDPGAEQMKYLKQLMLSKPYFNRKPAQEIISGNNGIRYHYIIATKGDKYAMAYTYTGRNFSIDCSKLGFTLNKAWWFNPRTGAATGIAQPKAQGVIDFDPPGSEANGNDWVLVLE